jgi:hypothetical protein
MQAENDWLENVRVEQERLLSAVEALSSDDRLKRLVAGWTMSRLLELGPVDADRSCTMMGDARARWRLREAAAG